MAWTSRGAGSWPLGKAWGDAKFAIDGPGRFVNVFTGEQLEGGELHLEHVLASFPVAWLLSG
jgi:hypothetical protein